MDFLYPLGAFHNEAHTIPHARSTQEQYPHCLGGWEGEGDRQKPLQGAINLVYIKLILH